jgi:hypothetical protein
MSTEDEVKDDDAQPTKSRSRSSRFAPVFTCIERIYFGPPNSRRLPLIAQLIIAVVALLLAGCWSRASADTLRVRSIHYSSISGAVEVTVSSRAPSNSLFALNLYRGHCPSQPADTDFRREVNPDGQPHALLANPPSPGTTGAFQLCVWTVHEDQSVGASIEVPAPAIPVSAAPPPPPTSTAVNDHPVWWLLVSWALFAVAVVVVVMFVAWMWPAFLTGFFTVVLARHLKRLRRRPSRRKLRQEERELDDLRARAETDSPDAAGAAPAASSGADAAADYGEDPTLAHDTPRAAGERQHQEPPDTTGAG